MFTVSLVEIDLSAIQHNVGVLRRIIGPDCALCPIVKANAYGLGAVRVAKALVAAGADLLAVYNPDEAAELFAAAVGGDILVLMPVRQIPRADEVYRGLVCGRLHLTVHDGGHLDDVVALSEHFGITIPVHLEVDTGMSRGGCGLDQAPHLLERISQAPRLMLAGLFTHFANAERDADLSRRQLRQFNALLEKQAELIPPECRVHAANSFATLRNIRYHKSMVRVGLAWAGYGLEWLSGGEVILEGQELQPALAWESRIIHIKVIEAGTAVGYGSTWTASRRSVIGLVPAGYADGYPLGAGAMDDRPAAGWVRVVRDPTDVAEQVFAPVVGAVNMDQVTIDLTDLVSEANAERAIGVGTRVQLITPDAAAPNHLPRLARAAGTIPHEMICRLSPRLPRAYRVSTAAAAASARPTAAAAS